MSRRRFASVFVLLAIAVAAAVVVARRDDRGDDGLATRAARATDPGALRRDATGLAAPRAGSADPPAFSEPDEPPEGVIEGRVLRLDGMPWSSGMVTARLVRAPDLEWSAWVRPDGTFGRGGLIVGQEYRLDAKGEGGRAQATATARVAGSGEVTTLRVEPSAALVVRFVDEKGEPVAGIESAHLPGLEALGHARGTSERGVYRIDDVPPGFVDVLLTVGDANPSSHPVHVVPGRNDVRVTVDLGLRIVGVVIDGRGRPADGVRVTAAWRAPLRAGDPDASSGVRVRTSGTDADGTFTFARLEAPGTWRLRVDEEHARTREPVDVVAGARDVRLVVDRAGRATVRFVDETGAAVTGDVEVRRERGEDLRSTSGTLGAGGLLRLDGFDDVAETVSVAAPGFSPFVREVRVPSGDELDLGTVTLRKGAKIGGTVVDAHGAPVHGAVVLVGGLGRTVTDPNGRFGFEPVPDGSLSLVVLAEKYLHREISVRTSEARELRVELAQGGHLEATVVGADGQGVGGLPIAIVPIVEATAGPPVSTLRTDEDGTFDVRVPPGRYRIEAKEDGAKEPTLLADVTLVDGEERRPTLVFRPR